jgi:hypothetical protein
VVTFDVVLPIFVRWTSVRWSCVMWSCALLSCCPASCVLHHSQQHMVLFKLYIVLEFCS